MTLDEYYERAVLGLLRAVEQRESLPAREAAESARYPGHPLGTVDAIEAEIRRRRAADAPLIAACRAAAESG